MTRTLILLLGIGLVILSCQNRKKPVKVGEHLCDITSDYTTSYFTWQDRSHCPWISAHRGGPHPGYPENCLETAMFCYDSIDYHLILEVDVRTTKDGTLILLHDESLDRTTTGTGLLAKYTYEEIENLQLIDNNGNETDFQIPKLADLLFWAKGKKLLLSLDIKRDTRYEDVIQEIEKFDMGSQSMIITYSLGAAKKVNRLAPSIYQSVSIRGEKEWQEFSSSSLHPNAPVVAFTGTNLSSEKLFTSLHSNGYFTILGTLGNLDRQARARGFQKYDEWKAHGVDIFATDQPYQLAQHWHY